VSITFHTLSSAHMLALQLQPSQLIEAGLDASGMSAEHAREIVERGVGWAAIRGEEVLCCAGIVETFADRQGTAWAMLAGGLGACAHLAITRFARARIAESPLVRVESLISDDPTGRCAKWARAVGMEHEATLAKWGAASETIHVYRRLR